MTAPIPTRPPTPLRSVLVANRGEIARRVFRTARARGMRTVAVFSDADADAPHAREADLAVRLPGTAPADTYLRADLVVAAALRAGADCVHPGYGFLSENAAFARAVTDAGLVFVGPRPEVVEAMGDKLRAKSMLADAGVPTLPSVDASDLDDDALAEAAAGIGYPVLVKAAFGGGGRGMRAVRSPDELADAVAGARREAASAFGDGTVFLERLVERPRHVEVQVFGDVHGDVVALFERECSIQRRHQKVVEEAPSPAVDAELRARLCDAAVRAAEVLGYTGAGTVEFLLAPDGRFAFLEVNTRLQVEHPVTEAVTGLDLVGLQLDVAEGRPLPPEVRDARLHGAAVEVRLYAEDPARGWLPQAGRLHTVEVPADAAFGGVGVTAGGAARAGVRLDSGVESGSEVGVAYDPMLAKVVAWAPERTTACALLADALRRSRIHGLVTNRDLLVGVLQHPAFLAGETDTGFLERHPPAELGTSPQRDVRDRIHAAAAALGQAALRRAAAPVLGGLPSGWRTNPSSRQSVTYAPLPEGSGDARTVRYRHGRDGLELAVDDVELDVALVSSAVEAVDGVALVLDVDAGDGPLRQTLRVREVRAPGDGPVDVHVDGPLGGTSLREVPRFPDPTAAVQPGSLQASMPGAVTRVAVAEGDAVTAGQLLLVLEAMKMEHPVHAPADGTVTALPVAEGTQVATGDVLVVVQAASGADDDAS